ncbi:uncharacterized protein CELE_EGAP1.1 [Caenorhabditis elegans]|uniref:Uncharacterized protein n=1 Tax=Caenorhabditis elegans TaxID=6239 RepID=G4SBR5_CAEEL|nr:Uncharacterized protein CELE_EGAP1.1 [Caenorhabditis elegans]CCD65980.2 Uncharacterized protein CELE_EGAP1.1 [Caenorhabditis elegans]|eukprot:NP_498288.3 Uncharacterized protein CELE_EGAP1.1 [Caenorhabditis elegans]
MPNRTKYYEKLREKRRLAREHAKKVQEERARSREMKEEKWTTRNEFDLISEHRQLQRKAYIEKIRKESQAMLEMAVARVKAHEKRENMLKQEIEEEVETVRTFITEQCEYYADIHQQISPPKERSVDQIVGEIETELKEVVVIQNLNIYIEMFQIYEIFSSVFNFDPKMPENVGVKEDDDKVFAKEIAQLEEEFEANTLKAESLEKEIAYSKVQIETENVKFAAIEQEKAIEIIKLEKQIKIMEAKLDFMKQDPIEIEEIEKLKHRVEEETQRNTEYAESLKYIKEMIRIKKAEKNEKKQKNAIDN